METPEFKFKIGDFVKHKAAHNYLGTKMLITGRGHFAASDEFVSNLYTVSSQEQTLQRAYVDEFEIEAYPEPDKK